MFDGLSYSHDPKPVHVIALNVHSLRVWQHRHKHKAVTLAYRRTFRILYHVTNFCAVGFFWRIKTDKIDLSFLLAGHCTGGHKISSHRNKQVYSGLHTNLTDKENEVFLQISQLQLDTATLKYGYRATQQLMSSAAGEGTVSNRSVTCISYTIWHETTQTSIELCLLQDTPAENVHLQRQVIECLLQLWTVYGLALDVPSQSWYHSFIQ